MTGPRSSMQFGRLRTNHWRRWPSPAPSRLSTLPTARSRSRSMSMVPSASPPMIGRHTQTRPGWKSRAARKAPVFAPSSFQTTLNDLPDIDPPEVRLAFRYADFASELTNFGHLAGRLLAPGAEEVLHHVAAR